MHSTSNRIHSGEWLPATLGPWPAAAEVASFGTPHTLTELGIPAMHMQAVFMAIHQVLVPQRQQLPRTYPDGSVHDFAQVILCPVILGEDLQVEPCKYLQLDEGQLSQHGRRHVQQHCEALREIRRQLEACAHLRQLSKLPLDREQGFCTQTAASVRRNAGMRHAQDQRRRSSRSTLASACSLCTRQHAMRREPQEALWCTVSSSAAAPVERHTRWQGPDSTHSWDGMQAVPVD